MVIKMKNKTSNKLLNLFLYMALFTIIIPIIILIIWSFTGQWPWPNLLPTSYSLRAVREISAPYARVLPVLLSSIFLSLTVALLSALVGTMTARALVFYDFKGKNLIDFLSLSPNLVPTTVFAMGIHVIFIKMSLADRLLGVIIVHLIYTLPYSTSIMKNLTESIGLEMELQAYVLGASPLKSFFHVSLPLLIPGILASISMAYIVSFSQYFLTLLIGGGKVKTFSLIMVPFIGKGDRSLSSIYGLVFIISTLWVFVIVDLIIKKLAYYNKKGEL